MKQLRTLSREKCKLIKQHSNYTRIFCHGVRKGSCKEFLRGIPARAPAKGFWNPVPPELWNLGALKPWKPAPLDSWSLVTLESCNPGSLELWIFWLFASLEPAPFGTLTIWIPWSMEVLEIWNSRVMELWNPKLVLLQPLSLATLPGNREPCEKHWTLHLVKL